MVELSPATTDRLGRLFRPDDVPTAARLLVEGCAFDAAVVERWTTSAIPGVAFRPGDRVMLVWGPARGRNGTVTALIGLEPEARYTVRLDGGEDTPAFQKILMVARY